MEELEDRVKQLEDIVDRQGILLEIAYQTSIGYGTDKVFTSPAPIRLPRKRSRSRSRSISRSRSPPPAPRKDAKRYREHSDYKIHVIARTKGSIVPDDIIGYIDEKYGITVTSCTVDPSGFTACVNCLTKDDQRLLLEEKCSELLGRFNLKGMQKRQIHKSSAR